MLIKTTHDDVDNHFFVSFSDESDTQRDQDITAIYYKVWAMNTNKDLLNIYGKKSFK